MGEKAKCPVCTSDCTKHPNYSTGTAFYVCPVCGRYQLGSAFYQRPSAININHLAAYLCHHRFTDDGFEYRYHTTLDKETCDTYRKEFDNGDTSHGRPVHMDREIVENWYPKTFAERVNYILLFINSHTKHVGQQITLSYQELLSAMFIDRQEIDENHYNIDAKYRNQDDCIHELAYVLDFLKANSYISSEDVLFEEDSLDLSLTPEGYARVEALQKNTSRGRNAFVAMQFGDKTKNLREAIRKGVSDAGYIATFIDEVQHNEFITPEILKHIRDSNFVVCDLTFKNNGAYFEEGYAMGLGKPVIQLCKNDTELHFDIAQKNTIIWSTEDDIPEKLTNRIKATID